MLGLVGRKEGTQQLYQEGQAVQVTFITVLPNYITQIKTIKRDGYRAVQLTTGQKALRKVTKAEAGHYNKAGVEIGLGLWEFRLDDEADNIEKGWKPGKALTVETFSEMKLVDVTGITKGKGFAGAIKAHHFSSQDATHGNSLSHRSAGSTGQRQDTGRVWPGKKKARHLGDERRTMQSLEVLAVYNDQNLLMVKGSVPGAPGGIVYIKRAVCLRNENKQVA